MNNIIKLIIVLFKCILIYGDKYESKRPNGKTIPF